MYVCICIVLIENDCRRTMEQKILCFLRLWLSCCIYMMVVSSGSARGIVRYSYITSFSHQGMFAFCVAMRLSVTIYVLFIYSKLRLT